MKKIVIALVVVASFMFAAQGDHKYEATLTGGFVIPEGNLDLDKQLSLGLRFGTYVKDTFFDQVEFGVERASSVNYKKSTLNTNINRVFVNIVKEYDITNSEAFYALVGLGYEDYTDAQFNNNDDGFAQYGVGFKQWATDNLALKYELRHAINFAGDSNLFATIGFSIPFGKKEPKPAPVVAKIEPTPPKPAPIVVKKEPKPAPVVAKIEPPRDDDKDGVYNKSDLCLQTPNGRVVNHNGCMKVVELRVNFETDKSDIADKYMSKIQEVVDFMKDNKSYKVNLVGHTDSIGSKKYNQALSQRRADAVKSVLKKLGVFNYRISARGKGELKPIMTNDTASGRAMNRRVEASFDK